MKIKVCLVVLVLSCLIVQGALTVQESQNITFPGDLQTLCPYSNFCGHDQDDFGLSAEFDESIAPCCSSCSCGKDCGLKRNCCKYEHDRYKLDETLGTICKQLNTIPYNFTPNEPFYHIVYLCPDRFEQCHTKNIPGWGDFYPVYSHESEMLYYNPSCAKCHGQVNITLFDPVVTCVQIWDSYFSAASMVKKGVENTDCTLKFIPPTHIDLSQEMCYPSIRRQCDLKELHDSETYERLCNSFNATFYTKFTKAYGNVFCFLCSSQNLFDAYSKYGHLSNEYEFCPAMKRGKADLAKVQFSILLDTSFNGGQNAGDVRDETERMWCTTHRKEKICRPLLCPEGQDYVYGRCRHLGSAWYFKHVGMSIQLETPSGARRVTVMDLFPTPFSDPARDCPIVLERPGFEDWELTLLYNTHGDNITISYFIALLFHKSKTIVPNAFIRKTMSSFNGVWKLLTNGLSFHLKPRQGKYLRYTSANNGSDYLPNWYGLELLFGDEVEGDVEKDLVRYFFGNRSLLDADNKIGMIFITKLFFCTLIELENHDWVDWAVRLYLLDRDKFLDDGEYSMVKDEYGIFRARICLHDFQQSSTGAAVNHPITLQIVLVCFFVIAYL